MKLFPPVSIHPLEIIFAHISLQLLLNLPLLVESKVTMMRNGWFKGSEEFYDIPVMVAVQQHALSLYPFCVAFSGQEAPRLSQA